MLTYKVFIHRDFELSFDLSGVGVSLHGGHVFNDLDNPTFFDTEEAAKAAVFSIPFNPHIVREGDRALFVQDVAAAVLVDVDERGREVGQRKLIASNMPDVDVLEKYVANLNL